MFLNASLRDLVHMFPAPYQAQSQQEPAAIKDWFRQIRNAFTAILKKNVAGGVQVNLTTDETYSNIIEFSGALTGNINVVVALLTKQWSIFNNTTGAFTLTVKTSGGTGIVVGQGKRAILYCDGTNVVRVTADV